MPFRVLQHSGIECWNPATPHDCYGKSIQGSPRQWVTTSSVQRELLTGRTWS